MILLKKIIVQLLSTFFQNFHQSLHGSEQVSPMNPSKNCYVALLSLSEQKNHELVQILSTINEFTLEILVKTAEDSNCVQTRIDVIKSSDSTDEEVGVAEY